MTVRVRYAGLRNRVRVTDGHEAAAKAAQLRKPPNRLGLSFLRMLGFQGQVARREVDRRGHAASKPGRPGKRASTTGGAGR